MAPLKLFVFGPPRLERDGHAIELSLRKALALLVYLAVTARPQSRDTLAALLWPKSDQREARASLRRTLHRLREALGDDLLDVDADIIRLHPHAELWLDATAFQEHVATGLSCTGGKHGLDAGHLAQLRQAASLYTDDFLAGFAVPESPAWDEWQFFERERLRHLFAQALERLVEGFQAWGDWEVAIGHARRWVGLDTLHEPAHRALMQIYAQAGQQAAAVRQYQECVRVLQEELGAEPDKETTALYEAIRARHFSPRIESVAQGEASERTALTPVQRQAVSAHTPADVDYTPPRPAIPASAAEQQIRFCLSPDGVRIAYATIGEGPLLIKSGNPLTHVAYDWQSPVWRHWWEGLARHRTFVRYDERGCGLSDWNVTDFSIDAWVRDLETVANDCGAERFALLGVSQGASVAIAYAVRHPERVSHLILYGGYTRGRLHRAATREGSEEAQMLVNLIRFGWGKDHPAFRQVFTTMLIPEATAEQISWCNDLAHITASPENAAAMEAAFYNIDVSDLAPRVRVPTLVLHACDDAMCPFEEGRLMATLIPGARFVVLQSKNHILLESEPAWQQFLSEVQRFIQGEAPLVDDHRSVEQLESGRSEREVRSRSSA